MKAAVLHAPEDLRIETRDVAAPGPRAARVRIAAGGICGSDLHYFYHGGFGTVRLKQPMVLGHEVAGVIDAIGAEVRSVAVGDHVAVNPSRPCRTCAYCQQGLHNHCADVRFYGSAMRMPHVQGAFCQAVVADEAQCVPVPATLPLTHAACAEPLAVGLHAVQRAGSLVGKCVLVSGQGPIGVLAVAAARHAGAAEIIATDIVAEALAIGQMMGADRVINVAEDPRALAPLADGKGQCDIVFEASGNAQALSAALNVVRPRGIVVQIGLGGDVTMPMNTIVAKEIDVRGTFRFHEEFAWSAKLIGSGRIDVAPLITEVVPMAQANHAFALAADRRRAMKVQLDFA